MEKHQDMEISSFYDRDKPAIAKSQRGFITYIIKPLFDDFAKFILADKQAKMIHSNLTANQKYWNGASEDGWELPEESKPAPPIPLDKSVEDYAKELFVLGRNK